MRRPFLPLFVITISCSLIPGCTGPAEPSERPVAVQAAPEPVAAEAPPTVARALIGRGGTLDGALRTLEIPDKERPALLTALGNAIDLRRLRPDAGVAVTRGVGGEPLTVSCRPEPERFVRALRGTDGWRVESVDLPVVSALHTAGGRVEQSLAQSLAWHPEGIRLAAAVADIFQWDIDLLVDPRPGDRVRVVYLLEELGALPQDLPPYGDRPWREGDLLRVGRVLAASYDGVVAGSTALWVEDDGRNGGYYDPEGNPQRKTFLKSPLNYRRISSGFSRARRNPVTRKVVPHHGVDYAAAPGTPVVATADGRVRSAGWKGALGRAVVLRHANGYETIYGHLSRIGRNVRAGTRVSQNQVVGYVGSTGRATGPHLHYTLKKAGRPLNPLRFKAPSAEPLPEDRRPELARLTARWLPVLHATRVRLDGVAVAASTSTEGWGSPGWGI